MRRLRTTVVSIAAMVLPVTVLVASCSSADDTASSGETTTTDSGTPSSSSETTDAITDAPASSPVTSGPSETSPSESRTLSGTGYTVALPADWEDVIEQARNTNAQADIAIAEPAKPGAFRLNFNVVQPSTLPAGVSDKQLAAQAAKELKSVTHAQVVPVEGPAFDGAPSLGQVSRTKAGGFEVTLVQYLIKHQGRLYPTTLTFETSREDEAQAVMQNLVASWMWKSG